MPHIIMEQYFTQVVNPNDDNKNNHHDDALRLGIEDFGWSYTDEGHLDMQKFHIYMNGDYQHSVRIDWNNRANENFYTKYCDESKMK